ncbi:MAG: DoxX family protein [Parvibaculaceae bacterium]
MDKAATSTPLAGMVERAIALCEQIPYSLAALAARIFPAAVFWQSGQTKLDGWRVSDNAIYLFREEYRLPVIDPAVAAHLAAFAEHAFPILLVLGLATRFAALALIVMTLVIQVFVYPGAWPTHGTWIACFLILIARGAGAWSLDHVIWKQYCGR